MVEFRISSGTGLNIFVISGLLWHVYEGAYKPGPTDLQICLTVWGDKSHNLLIQAVALKLCQTPVLPNRISLVHEIRMKYKSHYLQFYHNSYRILCQWGGLTQKPEESTGSGGSWGPVTLDVSFDLHLNKGLNKQWCCRLMHHNTPVTSLKCHDLFQIVKAFVVLRADAADPERPEELVKELQDHVKTITAPYKYPRKVRQLRKDGIISQMHVQYYACAILAEENAVVSGYITLSIFFKMLMICSYI